MIINDVIYNLKMIVVKVLEVLVTAYIRRPNISPYVRVQIISYIWLL